VPVVVARPLVNCAIVNSAQLFAAIGMRRYSWSVAGPSKERLVGWSKNMCRVLRYTVLILCLTGIVATAADRYGGWLLEQPRNSVRTLSFKQSVQFNNKIVTSELGFVCDQRKSSKSVGVILIPFDGTFQNDRNVVPVLIQKNADQYDPSDLLQNWKNGAEYIFLEAKSDVDRLATFIKANEIDGSKSVHFTFPNDTSDGPQTSNHVTINLSGFSSGFDAFQMECAWSQ
jgi:hypothetical protein